MPEVVLVTGGYGVIGSWVCRELVARGCAVVALDLAEAPAVSLPELSAVRQLTGDLRHPKTARQALDAYGVARVIHLAGVIGERAEADPALAIEVNAVATARLLEHAAERGLRRVIAMSTKGVLGPLERRYLHPTYEPVPVELAARPQSIYESSKQLVEALIRTYRVTGLSVSAFRLSTTWGPGKSGETHGGFGMHSDIVTRAFRGESSRTDVHPEQRFDLVYYRDVAAGLVEACLTEGGLASPVYHLGSGTLVTMAEFVRAVEDAFPGVRIELGDRMGAGRNCLLDITRSQADFGYQPRYPLRAAVADFRDHLGSVD